MVEDIIIFAMLKRNQDRLISIIILLAAIVYAARLPPDDSLGRFVLVGILVLTAVIWLFIRR